MIEVVVCDPTGRAIDRAEADTPEDAAYAADVLVAESRIGVQGERRLVRCYLDDVLVYQEERP